MSPCLISLAGESVLLITFARVIATAITYPPGWVLIRDESDGVVRSVAARRAASFARFAPGVRHPGPALFGHVGSNLLRLPGFDDGSEEQATLVTDLTLGLSQAAEVDLEVLDGDAREIWRAVEGGSIPSLRGLNPKAVCVLGLQGAAADMRQFGATLRLAGITSHETLAEYLTNAIAGAGGATGPLATDHPVPIPGAARAPPSKPAKKAPIKVAPKPRASIKKAKARQMAHPAGPLGQDRRARMQRSTRAPEPKKAEVQPVSSYTALAPPDATAGPVPAVAGLQTAPPATPLRGPIQPTAPSLPPPLLRPVGTNPRAMPPTSAARAPGATPPRPASTQAAVEFIAIEAPRSPQTELKLGKPTTYEKALRFLKRLGK